MKRLMMARSAALLAGCAIAFPALADEAGALRLRSALEPFVGKKAFESGAFQIAPTGEGYRLTFDVKPLLDPARLSGATVSMSPLSLLTSERSDGLWDVSGGDAFSLKVDVPSPNGPVSFSYQVGAGSYTGIWSPELGTFSSLDGRIGGGTFDQADATGTAKARFGESVFRQVARATASGDVDGEIRQTLESLDEVITIPGAAIDGSGNLDVTVKIARVDAGGAFEGFRSRPVLDVWAFLVGNFDPDGKAIKARQEELRGKLRALLPLWRGLRSETRVTDLSVSTAMGGGGVASAGQTMILDGIGAAGDYTYETHFDGLTIDSAFVPGWAKPLIPDSMRLGTTASDIDLESAARIALDSFDLNNADIFSADAKGRMAATFQGKPFHFSIDPSFIDGRDYRVEFDGKLTLNGDQVDMDATVTASGIDAITQALQSANTQEAFQAAGMLGFAKGYGRPLPDGRTRWAVEANADGSVLVNGVMVKPADVKPGAATP